MMTVDRLVRREIGNGDLGLEIRLIFNYMQNTRLVGLHFKVN